LRRRSLKEPNNMLRFLLRTILIVGLAAAYADWLPSLLSPSRGALSRSFANYANMLLPVRIIWGDKDTVTPPAAAKALARAIG
tara:strand:+ start:356 stop:604 length:249 start_codon:yes stop_codon:yes gene_type:complete